MCDEQRPSTAVDMHMHSVGKARRVLPGEFIFPDPHDLPSFGMAETVDFVITFAVAGDFIAQKAALVFGEAPCLGQPCQTCQP